MMFLLAAGCSRLIGADFDRTSLIDGGGEGVNAREDAGDAAASVDATANDAEDGPKPPTTDAGDAADADELDARGASDASDAQDGSDAEDASDAIGCGQCHDNEICCAGTCKQIGPTDCFECGAACGATRPVCDIDARVCVCTATSCPNGQICCAGGCKPIDAANCFSCGAACGGGQPVCALDVKVCTCTASSCPDGQICVAGRCARSSVLPMAAPNAWTSYPYYGDMQTSFADVNHDGRADAIAVNASGITVHLASANGAFVADRWTTTDPFVGANGTFFADVTGDGCADAIAVGDTGIVVRRSDCVSAFGTSEAWGPYIASRQTSFADVDGDGCDDAISLGDAGITVRRASPCPAGAAPAAFGVTGEAWTTDAFFGDKGTFFADVTGDGKADAIAFNTALDPYDGFYVRRSDGGRFREFETWNYETFPGRLGLPLVGDVTGDGMADVVAVEPDGAHMRRSNRWFLGDLEQLSDTLYSASTTIRGPTFALADVTGDGRADLVEVDDDGIWVNVTVDRRIPIRFIQLVSDAASALVPKQFDDAVAAANAVYRPANVQFYVRASDTVPSLTLHDLTGPASGSPADLAAATARFNPSCNLGADLGGLSPVEQMRVAATRCALDGEILVYVAHIASSTALLPWEGKAFFMDPADLAPAASDPFRLAHELGHYLGLPHVFGCCGDSALSHPDLAAGNLMDPVTGQIAPLSLFWDLVYTPYQMTNIMFNNASEAAMFESSLLPIQATTTTTDYRSGWFCPSADATRSCDPSAPSGTICIRVSAPGTRNYCSGDRELEGLGLRLADDSPTVNVMAMGYRSPVPDPSDVGRRQPTISLSQIQQIRRVLGSDIATPIRDAAGTIIMGGRPRLGL